jgi:hypothetical protein
MDGFVRPFGLEGFLRRLFGSRGWFALVSIATENNNDIQSTLAFNYDTMLALPSNPRYFGIITTNFST